MSTGHPALNRGLLLLTGVVTAGAGAALVFKGLRPPWAEGVREGWTSFRESTLPRLTAPTLELPGAVSLPAWALVVAAVAIVLAVVLVVFLATAHRSTTRTVVHEETSSGTTSVDQQVAEIVLAQTLSDEPEVASAAVRVYTVNRGPTLELTVRVRRGADLSQVVTVADSALQDWERIAGRRLPVVLRLADRTALSGGRAPQRVS